MAHNVHIIFSLHRTMQQLCSTITVYLVLYSLTIGSSGCYVSFGVICPVIASLGKLDQYKLHLCVDTILFQSNMRTLSAFIVGRTVVIFPTMAKKWPVLPGSNIP